MRTLILVAILCLGCGSRLPAQQRPSLSLSPVTPAGLGGPSATASQMALIDDLGRIFASPLTGGSLLKNSNPLRLLNWAVIRNELKMTPQQYSEINLIEEGAEAAIEQLWRQSSDSALTQQQELDQLNRRTAEISQQRDSAIEAALTAAQRVRIRQIYMQMQMRAMGEADALVSEPIAEQIKLSPTDKLRIRDRAIRVDQELRDEIDQLIRQARQKLRGELNAEQQSLLNELIGAEFDLRLLAPRTGSPGEVGGDRVP